MGASAKKVDIWNGQRGTFSYDIACSVFFSHPQPSACTQELQPASGYMYNAVQRWYYDPASTQYYGGDPPTWATDPPIPKEARYEVMHAPDEAKAEKRVGTLTASASESLPKIGATRKGRALFKPEAIAHPLSQVGGHQMPREGRIGGAKGAGSLGGVVISEVGKVCGEPE